MTTLLEKFQTLTDDVMLYPNGLGYTHRGLEPDDYRTWAVYSMRGPVDLNAVVSTFTQHLEELDSPWDGRTVSINGREYPLALGIRIAPVTLTHTLVHVYPTTELKGTL